jgi:hypothetical protein
MICSFPVCSFRPNVIYSFLVLFGFGAFGIKFPSGSICIVVRCTVRIYYGEKPSDVAPVWKHAAATGGSATASHVGSAVEPNLNDEGK